MAKIVANEFVLNVNHENLKDMIKRSYYSNVPVMIWGAPGIGKSSVVRQAAEEIAQRATEQGLEFLEWNKLNSAQRKALASATDNTGKFIYGDCRLSQYDPSDWAMPWVQSGDDTDMVWAPSQMLRAFAVPGTQGMLFLDELPQAQPSVQNAAYQIILDRMYKDVCFQNIRMVAAGNRTMDGGNQYAYPPALANRFTHVELMSPDGKEWVQNWARDNGVHPLICAFIQARPHMLYEDTGKTENRRYAWPSPRSWEMASKLLYSGAQYESSNAEAWVSQAFNLLYVSVGKGAAMEFQAYMLTLHDVFLEDFLKDPNKIEDASTDVQLGIQAMLEFHAKNVAKKSADKDKIKLLEQVVAILECNFRADMKCMFFGGVLRAFRESQSVSGWSVITKILHGKDNAKLLERYEKQYFRQAEMLTGKKIK